MEFLRLGDDEILMVLQYVDTADLLRCRAVCRKLKDLAFHPELWRRRWIMVGSYYSKSGDCNTVSTDAAALRLAPCARTLALSDPFVVPAAARMRCAAMELMLPPFRGGDSTAKILADIVVNQARLGRLKELLFELHMWPGERLANIILQAKGLSALTLFSYFEDHSVPKKSVDAVLVPTLKKIWLVGDRLGFFLKNILSGHAETLEEVTLQWRYRGRKYLVRHPADSDCGQTVSLLLKIPHLRKLTTPLLMNLEHLRQISSLTALTLDVSAMDDVESAKRYLKSATAAQLTYLGVRCVLHKRMDENDASVFFDRIVTVLSAFFQSSRPCKVETLDLRVLGLGDSRSPPPFYDFLFELLESAGTKLPVLKCLVLETNIPIYRVKDLMTMPLPELAPKLARLEIGIHGCLHFWMHMGSHEMFIKARERREFKTVFLSKAVCVDSEPFSARCEFCRVLLCHLDPGSCNDFLRTTLAKNF